MIGVLIRRENTSLANKYYVEAIERFGGEVVLIDDGDSREVLDYKLKMVTGILLTGGDDVGPLDFYLIKYALENNLKLLGICQGMQSMALYGSDDTLVSIKNFNHKREEGYVHYVNFSDGRLARIMKKKRIRVNSHHLQTVKMSHLFSAVGYSDDLLIEAIESNNDIFQIGVQWHPERMLDYDINSRKLIKEFVSQKNSKF